VTLLGTGSADGWPNPWCDCASCAWARRHEVRGQTAVLVDGVLLLDCGPDVPRTAARLGVRLSGLRHLLISHAHPDHLGPESLMWRSWSSAAGQPLDIVAPPAALAVCREFLTRWEGADPTREGAALRFVTAAADGAAPGDDPLRLGPDGSRYVVRPLAARHGDASIGPAVLYDVTAPDGGRLLYGCDTAAPLPAATVEALTGRAYDVVLLEENNGDRPGFGEHLDLDTFGQLVAELRRRGAVVDGTRVLAVHLSHRNPPGDELARRLAQLGARAPADGDTFDVTPIARPTPTEPASAEPTSAEPTSAEPTSAEPTSAEPASAEPTSAERAPAEPARRASSPYRVLITGGARSGKSAEAERLLLAEPAVMYVATSAPPDPADAEWSARIAAHRERRPAAWTTVETLDLVPLLGEAGPPLLVDDIGLWVAAHLDDPDELAARTAELVEAWRFAARRVVAVTNEVGSGVVPPTPAGRRFRDALGRVNAALAAAADEVWQVVAGIPVPLRRGDQADGTRL
jgi:adenosylcobinamide kinase/adenosylcobinamide-phosphate guanylyltransferase